MSAPETCPKCSARFEAREALDFGGVPLVRGVIFAPGVSTKVRCPGCDHIFSASNIKFFGFLSANALRWGLVLAVIFAVVLMVLSSVRAHP